MGKQLRQQEAAPGARELAELKQATREAHEAIKDLRTVLAEARVFQAESLAAQVDTKVHDQVADGLARYQGTLAKAVDDATAAVFRRFDTIVANLLGHDDGTSTEEALRRFTDRVRILDAETLAHARLQGTEPKGRGE
jgi:hypothetical protein